MDFEYAFRADKAGQEMFQTIVRSTAVLYWHADGGPVLHNGSMFFLDTKKALFGVTARHVYEGYLRAREQGPMTCQIGNLVFDPTERLIDLGRDVDIATFRVTEQEIAELGRLKMPWPPKVPVEGAGVFVCGLPSFARDMPAPSTASFKHYVALMRVDSVSDRAISMVRQPDEEMMNVFGGDELPEPHMDIGGMSGGPVALNMKTPADLTCWFISAVIAEGHKEWDIIHAARADWINEDGTIRG